MQDPDDKPYHHGNLRSAIVETAAAMLREESGWQFTLREVARRAGVSHAAPYKHFADKAALLTELALQGFEQLSQRMNEAITPRPRTPRKALLAASQAYIDFGVGNPSLYRLMFGAAIGSPGDIHLSERAKAAMGVLVGLLEHGQQAGAFKRRPVTAQAAACWALVHGLTMLSIDGLLLQGKVGDAPVQAALAILLEGLES